MARMFIKHAAAKKAKNQSECSKQPFPPRHSKKRVGSSSEYVSKQTKSQVTQSFSQLLKGKEKQQIIPVEELSENWFLNADAEEFLQEVWFKRINLGKKVILEELTEMQFVRSLFLEIGRD